MEYAKISLKQQAKLKAGIDTIADTVKTTLGPAGKNVLVQGRNFHLSTKDGVSVAKFIIKLRDDIENIGANLIKDVASKAADETGDGTTTATVLAQGIYTEALKTLDHNKNIRELRKELKCALDKVKFEIDMVKVEVTSEEQIRNVARVSANGDEELGDVVADTFNKVGENSPITIEDSQTGKTYYTVTEGYILEDGVIDDHSITDFLRGRAIIDNTKVLVTKESIVSLMDLVPLLEQSQKTGEALTIFCSTVSPTAYTEIINNRKAGNVDVNIFKVSGSQNDIKEKLEEIAIITNSRVIDPMLGDSLSEINMEDIGSCKRIEANKKQTVLINDEKLYKGQLDLLIDRINTQLSETNHAFDIDKYTRRINRLSCKVGVISVGGNTEIEIKEKKDRIDDALGAVRSAKQQGIIVGGGVALYYIGQKLLEFQQVTDGERIVYNAIQTPFKQILDNAGMSMEYWCEKLNEQRMGLGNNIQPFTNPDHVGVDVFTEQLVDLFEQGITDPVKVTVASLEAAISVVGELLTTDAIITIEYEKDE